MSSKGQIWTIDLTSASVILSFILLLSLITWNGIAGRWNSADSYMKMHTNALFAAESLMTKSGVPKSWEMRSQIDGNISSIGLVNGRNELNNLKMEKLVSENETAYDNVKERLGLQKYELGIRVSNIENNVTYHEFGKFAESDSTTAIFERMGILNESAVIVRIEVWK